MKNSPILPVYRNLFLPLILAAAAFLPNQWAGAFVHLWEINQVYSNEDGSVQYIELWVCCNGENFTSGRKVVTHRDGGQNQQTFTFPSNLPSSATANRHLLLATGPIEGVVPDYIIPENFVPIDFKTAGTVDISEFATAGNPNRVDYDFLPTDGFRSLDRNGNIQDPATVTNFSGDSATLTPPDPDPPPEDALPGVSAGDRWKWSPWFGFFHETSGRWLFHPAHGMMYLGPLEANPEPERENDRWLFSPCLGWVWTGEETYPHLYSAKAEGWLFFALEEGTGRSWYFSFEGEVDDPDWEFDSARPDWFHIDGCRF